MESGLTIIGKEIAIHFSSNRGMCDHLSMNGLFGCCFLFLSVFRNGYRLLLLLSWFIT